MVCGAAVACCHYRHVAGLAGIVDPLSKGFGLSPERFMLLQDASPAGTRQRSILWHVCQSSEARPKMHITPKGQHFTWMEPHENLF